MRRPRSGTHGAVDHGRWSPLRWKQPAILLLSLCKGSLAEKISAGLRVLLGSHLDAAEGESDSEDAEDEDPLP